MSPEEIHKEILSNDSFVLAETKRLQYLFMPKKIIRSHLTRADDDVSESVAEHVYGMMLLIEYFKQVEPKASDLDYERIHTLVFAHDLSEIETGDISTNVKTKEHRDKERKLFPKVVQNSPLALQTLITKAQEEYEAQETPEARFVKAIDKLEPLFEFYNDSHKAVFHLLKFTNEDLERTKRKYIEPYETLFRFYQVIQTEFINGKFFYEPS